MTCDRSVVSSINKTDHHDITEIVLKVALNTITTIIVEFKSCKQNLISQMPFSLTQHGNSFCFQQFKLT